MLIRFTVCLSGKDGGASPVWKMKDLPFVPMAGMQVHDRVWQDPKVIERVIMDMDESTPLFVEIEQVTDESMNLNELVAIYVEKGWDTEMVPY